MKTLRKFYDKIQIKRSYKKPVRLSSGTMYYEGKQVAGQVEDLIIAMHHRSNSNT